MRSHAAGNTLNPNHSTLTKSQTSMTPLSLPATAAVAMRRSASAWAMRALLDRGIVGQGTVCCNRMGSKCSDAWGLGWRLRCVSGGRCS